MSSGFAWFSVDTHNGSPSYLYRSTYEEINRFSYYTFTGYDCNRSFFYIFRISWDMAKTVKTKINSLILSYIREILTFNICTETRSLFFDSHIAKISYVFFNKYNKLHTTYNVLCYKHEKGCLMPNTPSILTMPLKSATL